MKGFDLMRFLGIFAGAAVAYHFLALLRVPTTDKPSDQNDSRQLEAKELANIYLQQFSAARLSFDQRRSYQLKVGIAIWGALLTLVVALIKGDEIKLDPWKRSFLPAAGVLLFISHAFFLSYGQKAGKVDQCKAECFERLLNEITNVPPKYLEPTNHAIDATQKGPGRGQWVEVAHLLVTGILVLALAVLA